MYELTKRDGTSKWYITDREYSQLPVDSKELYRQRDEDTLEDKLNEAFTRTNYAQRKIILREILDTCSMDRNTVLEIIETIYQIGLESHE